MKISVNKIVGMQKDAAEIRALISRLASDTPTNPSRAEILRARQAVYRIQSFIDDLGNVELSVKASG